MRSKRFVLTFAVAAVAIGISVLLIAAFVAALAPSMALAVESPDDDAVPHLEATFVPQAGPVDFRRGSHHIIGNRMRLGRSSEVRLDEGWRQRLNDAQIATIVRRTSRHRRRLGYT